MSSTVRSRRGARGWLIAGLALLALALLAPAAGASVRCTESANGVLRVTPFKAGRKDLAEAGIRRDGERVLVLANPYDKAEDAIPCAGPPATVADTTRIVVSQSDRSYVQVQLASGPPAARIELRTSRGALGYGSVVGTGAADRWTIAGDAGAAILSLDPAEPEPLQVIFTGLGRSAILADPHSGNDRVDASAIRDPRVTTTLNGGPGDDTLLGSPFRDTLVGGKGRDRLVGNGGDDRIRSLDEYPDTVACGAGTDEAKVGRGDTVSGCEKLDRPGPGR